MAFDFPSSPTNGQVFTPAGGPTYTYNGYAWVMQGGVGNTVPEAPNDGKSYARRNATWIDIAPPPVAIASSVPADFSLAQVQAFTAAVAAAFVIANPSANPAVGIFVSITITMTAAGAVTFGSNFKGLANYTQSTWSSGTVRDHIVFRWSGTTYDLVGAAKGINL